MDAVGGGGSGCAEAPGDQFGAMAGDCGGLQSAGGGMGGDR